MKLRILMRLINWHGKKKKNLKLGRIQRLGDNSSYLGVKGRSPSIKWGIRHPSIHVNTFSAFDFSGTVIAELA